MDNSLNSTCTFMNNGISLHETPSFMMNFALCNSQTLTKLTSVVLLGKLSYYSSLENIVNKKVVKYSLASKVASFLDNG